MTAPTEDALASQAATLSVPAGDGGRSLRFLVAYLNPSNVTVAETSTAASLKYTEGTTVDNLVTIYRCLACHSELKPQLLGTTPDVQAQIAEWLTWTSTELNPLIDDKLAKVNDWLLTRTFLVGNDVTLADLVVFTATYPATSKFPVAQTGHFANLLRWADYVAHVADKTQVFPPLTFTKPSYQPPPPPQPAAPAAASSVQAAAKGAAKDAGGKDKGAADKKAESKPAAAAAAAPAEKGKGGAAAPAPAATAAADGVKAEKGKADKKEKKEKKEKAPPAKKEEEEARIDMLDIRVGQIVKVDKHPNADALYLEEIDLGEEKPRQVISGLVKWVPKEQMENRRVVVVCNLKPAKLKDVMSYGMVFCATSEAGDKTEPIIPPAGAAIGERITFEGFSNPPADEINPKKKVLERLFPDLKTDANGVAVYKDAAFMTSAGPVTSSVAGGVVK